MVAECSAKLHEVVCRTHLVHKTMELYSISVVLFAAICREGYANTMVQLCRTSLQDIKQISLLGHVMPPSEQGHHYARRTSCSFRVNRKL